MNDWLLNPAGGWLGSSMSVAAPASTSRSRPHRPRLKMMSPAKDAKHTNLEYFTFILAQWEEVETWHPSLCVSVWPLVATFFMHHLRTMHTVQLGATHPPLKGVGSTQNNTENSENTVNYSVWGSHYSNYNYPITFLICKAVCVDGPHYSLSCYRFFVLWLISV